MKDIKIAFFDIDGTLVDFQKKYMTEKTRQALCALRANGIRICIATGRTPVTVPKFEGVDFDAYLTFNGAYCYDAQGTIFSRTIPGQDVERLIRNAAALHRPVCVSTDKELGANGWEQNLADYFAIGLDGLTEIVQAVWEINGLKNVLAAAKALKRPAPPTPTGSKA